MTIVASVKVRDGMVVATDSKSHITAGNDFITAFDNARKLFQVGALPISVATYGLGNIGPRSIERVVLDFVRDELPLLEEVTLTSVTQALFEYIKADYDAAFEGVSEDDLHQLGILVSGYSDDEAFAQQHEFLLPGDSGPSKVAEPYQVGATWRGVDLPFTRLWMGFDPQLMDELLAAEVDPQLLMDATMKVEAVAVYNGMPVQDAIDFATFILKTTIGWSTFVPGVPSCGGPLQVAVILPDEGFRWVTKPELGPSTL